MKTWLLFLTRPLNDLSIYGQNGFVVGPLLTGQTGFLPRQNKVIPKNRSRNLFLS